MMRDDSIRSSRYWALVITLLAFALRVLLLEDRYLTIDEAASLKWIADRSLAYIVTHYHTNSHMLISVLARLADYLGHWLILYRGPSVILGVLTIPLLYQLSQRLFDVEAGLLAGLLLAVAPFHVDFSQQMRGYAAVAFWATVMYFCLWQALTSHRRRYWLGFALSSVLTVYAHLFGALAVGASWLIMLGTYLAQWWSGRSPLWIKAAWVSLLITASCLALLYSPIAHRILATPYVEANWPTQIEPMFVGGRLNPEALEDYLKVFRLYGPIGEPDSWFVRSFVLTAGLGTAAALARQSPKGKDTRRATLYVMVWIFCPIAIVIAGLQFITGFYAYRRFFIFFQPLYLLMMANGMLVVGRLVARRSRRPAIGLGVTSLLVMISLGAAGWGLYRQAAEDTDNQWHRVAQAILDQGSNPVVICEPYGERMREEATHRDECYRNMEFYLQSELGQEIPWLHREVDEVATVPGVAALPSLVNEIGDVWLVIWQPDWPPSVPAFPPEMAGVTWSSVGSTLLVHAWEQPAQLLALVNAVDALAGIETTPEDSFSYYLSLAQVQALVGNRDAARTALGAARAISPQGIDADNRLKAVAELIGMDLD